MTLLSSPARALLLLAATSMAGVATAQVVTTNADSGPGSLREALVSGTSDVTFASSLDGQTLTLASPIMVARDVNVSSSASGVTVSGSLRFSGDYTAKFNNVSFANSSAMSGGAIWSEGTDVFVFGRRLLRQRRHR